MTYTFAGSAIRAHLLARMSSADELDFQAAVALTDVTGTLRALERHEGLAFFNAKVAEVATTRLGRRRTATRSLLTAIA